MSKTIPYPPIPLVTPKPAGPDTPTPPVRQPVTGALEIGYPDASNALKPGPKPTGKGQQA